MAFLVLLFVTIAVVLLILLLKAEKALKPLKQIQDVDSEIAKRHIELESAKAEVSRVNQELEELRAQLATFETSQDLFDVGFYHARYSFETASEYQARLNVVRESQKALISGSKAVLTTISWSVGGSEKEGQRITDRIIKLALRAFNGECDAIIAKVKYGNYEASRDRIEKSRDAINRLGEKWGIQITDEYFNLIVEELQLVYEYQEKLSAEKEEQRRIREQIKEEERAQKELERAKEQAEKEEQKYEEALEKAREEVLSKHGAERDKLAEKISKLEADLQAAIQRKERAISQAQLTKSGHVYVISNIGSFGENVYKIGMTRRLEPIERIHELGDASVPFSFDVHAMVYSTDAPGLENALHRVFDQRRVNLVNERREFFAITLREIEEAIGKHDPTLKVQFTMVAEAKEYRQTLALRNQA